jgi:hypothetical protein
MLKKQKKSKKSAGNRVVKANIFVRWAGALAGIFRKMTSRSERPSWKVKKQSSLESDYVMGVSPTAASEIARYYDRTGYDHNPDSDGLADNLPWADSDHEANDK